MAATMQLSRRLVMSGGNGGRGQFIGVRGIQRRLFSSRGGTPAGGLEAPNNKPSEHYNEDLHRNNPSHPSHPSRGYSSRNKYVMNTSEKRNAPIKTEYGKLKYRISKMERNFKKLDKRLDHESRSNKSAINVIQPYVFGSIFADILRILIP